MKKFKIILILSLFFNLNLNSQEIDFEINKISKIDPVNLIAAKILNENFSKDILINIASNSAKTLAVFILVYTSIFMHTLVHEFGHAITAKILCKSPIDIHLGSLQNLPNPLLKIKGLTIHTAFPLLGFSNSKYDKNKIENLKNKKIFINIAGPLFGIIITYMQKLILKNIIDKSNLDKIFLNKLINSNYFNYFITGQILYGLTPFVYSFGDGATLWKNLGLKIDTIKRLSIFDKFLKYKHGLPISLLALTGVSKIVFDSMKFSYDILQRNFKSFNLGNCK